MQAGNEWSNAITKTYLQTICVSEYYKSKLESA